MYYRIELYYTTISYKHIKIVVYSVAELLISTCKLQQNYEGHYQITLV